MRKTAVTEPSRSSLVAAKVRIEAGSSETRRRVSRLSATGSWWSEKENVKTSAVLSWPWSASIRIIKKNETRGERERVSSLDARRNAPRQACEAEVHDGNFFETSFRLLASPFCCCRTPETSVTSFCLVFLYQLRLGCCQRSFFSSIDEVQKSPPSKFTLHPGFPVGEVSSREATGLYYSISRRNSPRRKCGAIKRDVKLTAVCVTLFTWNYRWFFAATTAGKKCSSWNSLITPFFSLSSFCSFFRACLAKSRNIQRRRYEVDYSDDKFLSPRRKPSPDSEENRPDYL